MNAEAVPEMVTEKVEALSFADNETRSFAIKVELVQTLLDLLSAETSNADAKDMQNNAISNDKISKLFFIFLFSPKIVVTFKVLLF